MEAEKKKKKRRKKRYVLRFLIAAALLTGAYFVMKSALFTVEEIDVSGNSYYTKEQILSIAGDPRSENIWEVDLGAMQGNLAGDAYIESAKVARKLPATVAVTVTEREEACAVLWNGNYLVLDADGLFLRETAHEPALTVLTGLTVTEAIPGSALRTEENSVFSDTLRLVAKMDESNLWFREIVCSSVTVRLYIYETLVCEGAPENILAGMDALEEVLLDLYEKGIQHGTIRVSGDGTVSYSPAFE